MSRRRRIFKESVGKVKEGRGRSGRRDGDIGGGLHVNRLLSQWSSGSTGYPLLCNLVLVTPSAWSISTGKLAALIKPGQWKVSLIISIAEWDGECRRANPLSVHENCQTKLRRVFAPRFGGYSTWNIKHNEKRAREPLGISEKARKSCRETYLWW